MTYKIESDIMPLFLINDFLEAGKTQFLDFTMQRDYSRTEGKTLLIVCEEDDTGYDEKKLKKNKTATVLVDDMRKLTPQYLNKLEVTYQPERVLTKWDGTWNQGGLELPDDWIICRQITTTDDSTFELYVQNVKSLLGVMLQGSKLVIVNRCDGIPGDKLTVYRRIIRAMNQGSEITLGDKEREIEQAVLERNLPYDLGVNVIEVKSEDYGIWYIDCIGQPEHYEDEAVEFAVMVLESPKFPRGQFMSGRMTMTCCKANMTLLGFICRQPGAKDYKTKQWVRVRAKIGIKYQKDYHGEGPVLYAERMERAEEIKDAVQFQEQ